VSKKEREKERKKERKKDMSPYFYLPLSFHVQVGETQLILQ
jgi:hypothetical protein